MGNREIRFAIAGILNLCLGYVLFVAATFLFPWLSYLFHLLMAHFGSTSIAFLLMRGYVFRVRGGVAIDFIRFHSTYIVLFVLNSALLVAVFSLGNLSVVAAQGAILPILGLASYLGHRFFSFRRPPQ